MFSSLNDDFNGLRIVDYEDAESWEGVDVAYRLREEYDDESSVEELLDSLLEQPGHENLTTLIIGAWSDICDGTGSEGIVEKLAEVAPQLPGLRALFFGEITSEESELSWINQSDVSPLLRAFPKLESFRIRGGNGLSFSRVTHAGLRELAIEAGGISRGTIRELFLCKFPALERLELYLGEENYGFDGSVEDLQPLLSGKLFPKLKFLGLMNSAVANDIAAVVVNSPIVSRIETLDLSLGTLDSEGIQSLMGLGSHTNLKQLNISHHYATTEAVEALIKALPFDVIAEDADDPDTDWRGVVHAE